MPCEAVERRRACAQSGEQYGSFVWSRDTVSIGCGISANVHPLVVVISGYESSLPLPLPFRNSAEVGGENQENEEPFLSLPATIAWPLSPLSPPTTTASAPPSPPSRYFSYPPSTREPSTRKCRGVECTGEGADAPAEGARG